MPVTAITGAQFTVTHDSVAYTGQVTGLSLQRDTPVTSIRTLSDKARKNTDDNWVGTVDFLYDEETGMYGALNTLQGSGTPSSISYVGGDAKWTGSVYITSVNMSVTADGIATCSCSFEGSLTFADAP